MVNKIFYPGIIITDDEGVIVNFNEEINQYIKSENIIGTNIKEYDTQLSNYHHDVYKLNGLCMYMVNKVDDSDFFLSVINGSYDEIFVTDNKGTAIFCNNAFEKNYGISKDKVIGKHVRYLTEKGYNDVTHVDEVIRQKKAITFEHKTKIGKTILNTSTPVLDNNGDVMYVVKNGRDITEIEKLRNSLYTAEREIDDYKKTVNRINLKKQAKTVGFESPQMKTVYNIIERFASKDINILLLGQTGTGKSSIAKYIHEHSSRKDGAFVTINCSSINKELLESELFGYSSGAFTGASRSGKIGLVQLSDKGTLFLDEIGELPLSVQSKLLELVQEKTFIPVGDVVIKRVDTRIIAATNQNLDELMEKGLFRTDLYYRLASVAISLPPLSERKEDLSMLIEHYINFFDAKHETKTYLSKDTISALLNYSWPGNIRELEHLLEYLVLYSQGKEIQLNDLPINIVNTAGNEAPVLKKVINKKLKDILEDEKKRVVSEYYKQYDSSYKLSDALGISQTTAYKLIKKYCK